MEEKVTLGKFITRKRKEKKLSQREMAEQLFVTESAVSKWERGISYPDISLVSEICRVLGISEHELVHASEDLQQREVERQARTLRHVMKTYSWIFYALYGISLLTCFICNLAVNHTLSWFFIVLTAEMVSFSLTSLPLLIKKNKALYTVAAFFISLLLLLAVCCIYTGGNWFLITFMALLLGFTVLFLPFILREVKLPLPFCHHKALICGVTDTILIFLLVAVAVFYQYNLSQGIHYFIYYAAPITLFSVSIGWIYLIVLRYVRLNGLFRTAICLASTGVYGFISNSVIAMIRKKEAVRMPEIDLTNWSLRYLDGNINFIVILVIFVLAFIFCIGGIVQTVRKSSGAGVKKNT